LTINIVALGEVPTGQMITRGGASVGDDVWVSGTIGDAALGLRLLKGEAYDMAEKLRRAAIARFRVPEPRSALGPRLVGVAHACADVSDGLIADLGHICEVSGVGIELVAGDVPLSGATKAALGQGLDLADALSGGDDYELALTAPTSARGRLSAEAGVKLTRIGAVVPGKAVRALDAAGKPLRFERRGYTHF
jgi:thiamine-monophosphate kinase